VEIPEDLARALRASPEAAARWEALSEAHRRAHVSGILQTKEAETRARRIEETIGHLLEE
jgi:uncharacterized protein YdeI (YjbR/CyaY-like superfamily)